MHGDVSPGHLLLADDGALKLTDFGIARPLNVAASDEVAGMVMGTAGYLAPELALGHPPARAGDLYALGCVLYGLCTGQPPFIADTAVTLLHWHLHDTPVPPSQLRPDVPVELEQAILRLLAKDPAAAALVAAVTILVVAAIIAVTESGDSPVPLPSRTPAAQEPTRTPEPTRGAPSAATLAALSRRIDQQADSGRPAPETASKVDDQLRKIAEHLREGKSDEVAGKVAEIRGKLNEAAGQGRWTPDPTTMRLLDRLSAAR